MLMLYTTDDGKSQIKLRAAQQTVWLTQLGMAEPFDAGKQNISLHLKNLVEDGELLEQSVVKESLTTGAGARHVATVKESLTVLIAQIAQPTTEESSVVRAVRSLPPVTEDSSATPFRGVTDLITRCNRQETSTIFVPSRKWSSGVAAWRLPA